MGVPRPCLPRTSLMPRRPCFGCGGTFAYTVGEQYQRSARSPSWLAAARANRDHPNTGAFRVTPAGWVALVLMYLALHFALYVLKLRDLPSFSREWTIFSYHLWSFLGVTAASLLAWALAPTHEGAAATVAA